MKKLTGREGYRLQAGDWRALYLLDRGALIVNVIDILRRNEATYR